MTKYVLLTEFFPPDHGGIQGSLSGIAEALGEELTIIAPQKSQPTERRIIRSLFSGSGWPHWWWLVDWLRAAKKQGLQTAIFGHFSSAVLAGLVGKKFFGLEYIVLVHGNDLLSEQRRLLTRMFVNSALRNASCIGVNSSFVEHVVMKARVPLSRIVRTHPYVRSEDIPQQTIKSNGHRLITVSRLVARKNITLQLQAVAELRKTFSDIHLDIVGDGPERESLQQQANELHVADVVTFHGAVTDIEKWQLLQQANVFVMTPTIREHGTDIEGLGLVYVEAAACGLPIIASDTGGVRDIVRHEKTGIVVDPHSTVSLAAAITQLLGEPIAARRYGQAGRELVQQEFTDIVRVDRFTTTLRGVAAQEQPLVSIVIPAYQSAKTIAATLTSVQHQTWKKIEVIVVNDGSTDDIEKVLEPFQGKIIYSKQQNAGAPTARNVGFDRTQGDFVLFLDADIVLEPSAVEKMMITLLTHPRHDFVYSNFYFGWKKFPLFEYSSSKLRQRNYIHTSSLIRRSAFSRFDEHLQRFQDWDLWLTMAENGHRGIWIPEYLFRVHTGQSGSRISTWRPRFMYHLPLLGQGKGNSAIAAYRQAESIIRQKHHL